MTTQNIIFKQPYINPVVINITGIKDTDGNDIDLQDLTKVTAKFIDDERNSTDNPTSVVIQSATQLQLNFQDTTETNSAKWVISGTYAGQEYLLTSSCTCNLDITTVCE